MYDLVHFGSSFRPQPGTSVTIGQDLAIHGIGSLAINIDYRPDAAGVDAEHVYASFSRPERHRFTTILNGRRDRDQRYENTWRPNPATRSSTASRIWTQTSVFST